MPSLVGSEMCIRDRRRYWFDTSTPEPGGAVTSPVCFARSFAQRRDCSDRT